MNLELNIYKSIFNYFEVLSDKDKHKYIKYLEVNTFLIDDLKDSKVNNLYIQNIKDLKDYHKSLLKGIMDFKTLKILYRKNECNKIFILVLMRISHTYINMFQVSLFNNNNHGNISFIYEILSFTQTLSSKNLSIDIYKNVLYEAINNTDFNNFYLQSFILKEILYDNSTFKESSKEYVSKKNVYINQFNLINEYNKIKLFLHDISMNSRYNIYLNDHYNNEIKSFQKYFENIGIDPNRIRIDYFLFIISFEYYNCFDRRKINQMVVNFKSFLNNNIDVLGKFKIHEGYINIILQSYLAEDYENSLNYIHDMLKSNNISKMIILILNILLLAIYISTNNALKYKEVMLSLKKFEHISYYKTHLPTINFYHANYYFLSGNYKESIQHLQYCSSLLNDKAGYGMGIRILEIMNYMTWEHFDQVELALVNLKNQITALKKNGKLKPRYQYIYKILLKLHTSGYNYKNTFRIFASKLKLMASREDTMFRWDVRSPEMIRLDTWFFKQAGFLPPWPLD